MSLEDVRAALGDGPDQRRRTQQRARFLSEARGGRERGIWREVVIGLAAAGLGSIVVLMLWGRGLAHPSGLGQVESDGSAFVFNEHSEVRLQPGAVAHVERASGHDAVIVLERGGLDVSITSGLKNVWRFKAGEHQAIVRGTKFVLAYDPEADGLTLAVTEGKVEVRLSDGRLELVKAGSTLKHERPQVVEAAPAEVNDAPEGELTLEELDLASPGRAKKPAKKPLDFPAFTVTERRPLVPEWKRQAEAGRYAKAVTLVEEQGLEGAMAGVSSDDLLLFADAARLVRRADLGRTTLTLLRSRFPRSPDAAEAAFRLGRLESDAHQLPEAASWFDRYVQEAPDGPLAAEAMGRRLDTFHRLRDPREARAAREYVEKYPKGAYATLAQQVLQNP